MPRRPRRAAAHVVTGPWPLPARTAVLDPWFRVGGKCRVLEASRLPALRAFRPQALAGPVRSLLRLAALAAGSGAPLEGLEYGIVALGGIGRPPLTQADRDFLWVVFGAPVFEQFRDWSGELLAWECEAHAGLHAELRLASFRSTWEGGGELSVRTRAAWSAGWLPTGMTGAVTHEPCPCGRPGPRLIGLEVHPGLLPEEPAYRRSDGA
jgi:hypothetical protein